MSWSRAKFWRRIEDALTGELAERDRRALFDEVRDNPQARADYDVAFEAMREVERAPVAQAELDVVEAWLMSDVAGESVGTVAWWRRPWVAGALALVAAAALVVVLAPSQTLPPRDDGFQARGAGDTRGLAIDVLCPQRSGAAFEHGLVPASEYGCGLSQTMSFAYRVDPSATAGTLTLFGVDAAGDVLYYAPTPAGDGGIEVSQGTWTPLPMVVQLDVNHEPGPIVVYGLLSTQAPSVAQVDAMAAALVDHPPARVGDAPWHQRLFETPTLAALCAQGTCESAELTFTIHEAPR